MAVESIELGTARTVGRNRAELEYIIKGSDDDGEAVASLIGQAPTIYQGLALLDYQVEWEGPGLYRGRADYGPVEIARSDTGETLLSIDMSGETIHMSSWQ